VGGGFGDVIEKLRRSTVAVTTARRGAGSGVIWPVDGMVVTNAHVVGDATAAEVELWDGRRIRSEIVNRSHRRDLAALRVDAPDLAAAAIGDSGALRVGEWVVAVGNPLGFIGGASTGVIHGFASAQAVWGSLCAAFDAGGDWLVSQLRLAPGNSGGPLANARGEVIGLNTMIAGGLAFAVPSRAVKRFLSGRAGTDIGLGVVARAVRPGPLVHARGSTGLLVLEVIPQSPAERASLLQGDILVGANGRLFQSVQDLEIAIRESRAGILELEFRRGASSNVRNVAVQMAASPARAA